MNKDKINNLAALLGTALGTFCVRIVMLIGVIAVWFVALYYFDAIDDFVLGCLTGAVIIKLAEIIVDFIYDIKDNRYTINNNIEIKIKKRFI